MTETKSHPSIPNPGKARILAIASGKNGVGKTCFTTNLGVALAQEGYRVCIFDADTGLATITSLLNLTPQYTLEHLITGEKNIHEILIEGPCHLQILPASVLTAEFAKLDDDKQRRLFSTLSELESSFDYLLIDTAGGISDSTLNLLQPAESVFLIVTPEPNSLTAAFSLLKLFHENETDKLVYVVVNMVKNYDESVYIYAKFLDAIHKYLGVTVEYGGFIPLDNGLLESIRLRTPIVIMDPNLPASQDFFQLASSLKELLGEPTEMGGFSSCWQQPPPPPGDQLDVRRAADDHQPIDRVEANQESEQLLLKVASLIRSKQSDPTLWNTWFQKALESFVEQFNTVPFEPRQILYQSLELKNYPEDEIKEIAATLESLYQVRYHRPLRNLDDSTVKLLADAHGSEDKILYLSKQLRMGFKRQFQKDIFDAKQELIDQIQEPGYTEEIFQNLLDSLLEAFRQGFGSPYQSKSDLILKEVRRLGAELQMEQRQIDLSVNELEARTKHSAKYLKLLARLIASSEDSPDNRTEK